jgi:hypothetical protein
VKLNRIRIAGAERRVRGYFYSRKFAGTPLILCMMFLWPFGGTRKVQMMAGSTTPGATATISVKRGNNGNTALDIKAKNLAPPSSLTPAMNVYVVWIEAPSQAPQNQGRLRVNQNEQAEIHTSTSYKRFEVVITAEQNAQTQQPEGPRILSADIARD